MQSHKYKNPQLCGFAFMVPLGRIELPAHPYHGCVLPLYQCGMCTLYQKTSTIQEKRILSWILYAFLMRLCFFGS